ncbi:MAG: AAA family ATPase [Nanoarchaeota archaeon]|nr:AAA family ATPase [Nanoarchaeota archaeon]
MIIGLTGTFASGKDEIAKYLQNKGFAHYSLSDVIRDYATEKGLEHSRKNLRMLGNELRTKYGPAVLAKKIKDKFTGKDVVSSIRNPAEIEELKKQKDFVLIGVDAPVELRFERAMKRGRIENALTLKKFKENEKKENIKNKTNQQLNECLKMADKLIINDSTLEELYKKIEKVIK